MRDSSEPAEPRRLPTACFGLVRKQQTESYATQVVDSQPKLGDRIAMRMRETKRKFNPFVEECEASATQETLPKGVMHSERVRGLTLAKPLSLEQFATLMMSPPGAIQDPNFKTDIHPTILSSNSKSGKPHASMCNHPPSEVRLHTSGNPVQGIARPVESGGDLFLRAGTLLYGGKSLIRRYDCNTVGPVPVASGYGSRMLTQSAAHVLLSSKENASAISLSSEKRLVKSDNDFWALPETKVGVPKTPENNSGPTRGSDANLCGTQILHFTGSSLQSVEDGALKRQKAFNSMPKTSCFTSR